MALNTQQLLGLPESSIILDSPTLLMYRDAQGVTRTYFKSIIYVEPRFNFYKDANDDIHYCEPCFCGTVHDEHSFKRLLLGSQGKSIASESSNTAN